jgi:ribosomal-protein-alanine N-acetyltransferase
VNIKLSLKKIDINKGYATEAAEALIDYGFKALKLHRIIATCQPENIPSWYVAEKLGMTREAHPGSISKK